MKQYLTELRRPFRGARWVGPIVEAESMRVARMLMRHTPYRVMGALIHSERTDGGEIARFIQAGKDVVIH
jgi:hypothetical protein